MTPGSIRLTFELSPLTEDFVELRTELLEQLCDDHQGTKQDQIHLKHSHTIKADQLFLRLQDVTNNLARRAVNIINQRKKG